MEVFYAASDNYILVEGIQNVSDSSYINSGTVSLYLYDSAGVEITGQTWPLVMSYIAASDGDWDGNVRDDANLTVGQVVKVVIIADGGAGLTRRYVDHARVKEVADDAM